jgi:cyclophilin family peptidyl-prolyl cis-trans isomerase
VRQSVLDALRGFGRTKLADSLDHASPAKVNTPARYDDEFFRAPAERGAILHTSKGDIEWAFYRDEAPQTGAQLRAARAHRLLRRPLGASRRAELRDPGRRPDGHGARVAPATRFAASTTGCTTDAGMVGMALSGKDTGGSQWFITHSPQPHLDGRYTIFAHVVRGMDVVPRIVQGDHITRVEILP